MSDSDEDVRRFGGARTHTRQMDREGREGKKGEGGLWEGGGRPVGDAQRQGTAAPGSLKLSLAVSPYPLSPRARSRCCFR